MSAIAPVASAQFEFDEGDHVAFIGNALPDRMQHDGWLETYLQKANPDKRLVIRNMGLTGDRVAVRPRNKNFKSVDDYLTLVEADVIFAFFGYNESFAHNPDRFKKELTAFLEKTKGQQYNGESPPRIVLFSPIAHEDLGRPDLPDGAKNNEWLSIYTDAMASVARRQRVSFVDLFFASEDLYAQHEAPLTINGVHLNEAGNKALAQFIVNDLHGEVDLGSTDAIHAAVMDKNLHWFNRYRATDGNDIWGSRGGLSFVNKQSNRVVLKHELLMLDTMTANRDVAIWEANQGRAVAPDDSNVPDPVMVITNIEPEPENRAEDGGHKFLTAEEGIGKLTLAEGMKANVFASEEMFPELINPVQMDVDTKGRLWIAAWATYPKWQPDHEMLDRLIILPDEDRDGVADQAITFDFVHNPTAFTFWNGGVVVASAPNIWFLKDTDGDDVADHREILMSGLDSADTHHSANGFDYGPDGYIYYQRGIFNVSNVETPWQAPQLSGTSGMYRFNPRTHRFSFHAVNPPNAHGGDFDYWGYHYATNATGGQAFQVRPDGDSKFKMHTLLDKTVRPVPTSGIISSQHFPEKNNQNFIILNSIGFLGIKQYTLDRSDEGTVWGTETDDMLISSDTNFRPTDFKFTDDGALYVSDWANPIIGHMQHNIRDPNRDHRHGRVYRITVPGRPLQESVSVDGEPITALLDVLKHPTDGVRLRARIELSERNSGEVIAATQAWAAQFNPNKKEDAHHLLEALWLHQQHDVFNETLLNSLLQSPEPHARHAAERVRHMWNIEGKLDAKPTTAAAPKPTAAQSAAAVLQAASDYLKQEKSPDSKLVGDTFEVYIQTIKEQMRYDRTEFVVTPGLKVKLHFSNPDAMDHNLIMVQPSAAPKVAFAAMKLEADGTGLDAQWIPQSDAIIFASNLLAEDEKQTIEFTAPLAPGRYEYICTFPGHWQLMRGVMVVSDEFEPAMLAANQPAVADPNTSARKVVAHWEYKNLRNEVNFAQSGRSYEKGKELFTVATCSKCHAFSDQENTLGPDLRNLSRKYSPYAVLNHILDPSLEVADEYKTYVVEANGKTYYGTITAQDDTSLTILDNPLTPENAQTIQKADVKAMDAIDISPMPADLLITLNKEEIWDLLAYVVSGDNPDHFAFSYPVN
jgi:putative heme-binding domain-containing protein